MKYLLAFVLCLFALPATAATITMLAPPFVRTGENPTPTLVIENAVNVGAVTVTVTYDPAVLRVERCDASGTEFSSAECDIAFAPNKVQFAASSRTALSGDFLELGLVEFTAIGAAGTHSPLNPTIVRYVDVHGHTLPVSTENQDMVVVENPFTPSPTPITTPMPIVLLVENPDIVPFGRATVPVDVWDPGGFGLAVQVAALVATVHYDATLLTATGCTIGHDLALCFNSETGNRIPHLCFDTGFCDVSTPGQVRFSAGADTPLVTALVGTGLGSITFTSTTANASGVTPLTLADLSATDFIGQAIQVIPVNGSLTFEPGPTPTPLPACCGDSDGNGAISTAETTTAILALVNRDAASDPAAQCTAPGMVTTADATRVILNLVNRTCEGGN